MRMKRIVIVGGGYVGAMSALLFSENKDFHITLIEKQSRLGGLYSTAWSKDGYHFDFGSRAILATGIEMLDNRIASLLPDDEYPKTTDNLREFSFQNGQRVDNSNCLDARCLPADIFATGKQAMLALDGNYFEQSGFENLEQVALAKYGEIFAEHLIRPAIEKLTGLGMEKLHPDALAIHGLHRIIIADSEESKRLKAQNSFNEERIAFTFYNDHASTLVKTYPKSAGLDDFGDRIERHLRSLENVVVKTECSIDLINVNDGDMQSVVLDDGSRVEVDKMVWTVPSIFLAKPLGIDVSDLKPPLFRNTLLAHFLIDGDILTESTFNYNYDSNFQIYRASFYDNFCNRPDKFRSVTIESFQDDPDIDENVLEQILFEELKTCGLISDNSKIALSHLHLHRGSWPKFDVNFFDSQQAAKERIETELNNVYLLGKANGKHHTGALVHAAYELYAQLAEAE